MTRAKTMPATAPDRLSQLAAIPFFQGLDPQVIEELAAHLGWEYIPGGETLFRQGEVGDCLYAVLSGRLRVYVERAAEGEQVIGEVARGETVGEVAVLTDDTRSATVRAIRDTELVKMSKAVFDRFMEKHPQPMMHLARLIAGRSKQRGFTLPASKTLRSIAVVACNKEVPLREFVQRLLPVFGAIAPTLHLDRDRVERAVGRGALSMPDDVSQRSKIAGLLNDLEGAHRFVIYEADPAATSWTSWCVRQADCVLLVGRAEGEAAVTEIEQRCLCQVPADKPTARTELVLLHEGGRSRPVGTARWLAGRRVDAHHHVCLESRGDLERLVRLVTGRAVSLVLSGGGARGFAQIGVIRAIREAGIPIDYVGGTSMGAVIAAQLALGWDHKTLVDMNREHWVCLKPLNDYTLPIVGLLSGRKTSRLLHSMFGDVHIEDLPLNYFCVSSNLTRAQAAVHRHGPLWRWVRASVSIPGIGPPLAHDGELFVDGGVLNNLPVDVMRKLCEGWVVAAYTSEPEDFPVMKQDYDTISGWRMLWNRLSPVSKGPGAPNIFSILVRSMMLSSLGSLRQAKRQADVFIAPTVSEFGRFDWKAIDLLVEIGYVAARKKIEAWQDRHSAEY